MTEDTLVSHRRTGSDSTTSRSSGATIDGSLSAEEVRRIVEVAEVLQIDPQFARMALEEENGVISTDCGLGRSVAMAEKKLTPWN